MKCGMLMTQTRTQMTAMTLDRKVPKSSSFRRSGVISSVCSSSMSMVCISPGKSTGHAMRMTLYTLRTCGCISKINVGVRQEVSRGGLRGQRTI